MPNKVVITGFKDSLINENIIIKPEPIPPINHEKPIMKDTETNTNDEFIVHQVSSSTSRTDSGTQSDSPASSSSSSTSRTDSGTQSDSPASSEPEKANSELSNERKIKEKGYRLNELTAYPYDLIDVDDDANKDELAKKLNDVITHKNGAIAIVGGSFFSKCNKFTAYWIVNKQIYKIWNKESNQHT
nr:hypothetical protein [Mycoplasmopsis bovis]